MRVSALKTRVERFRHTSSIVTPPRHIPAAEHVIKFGLNRCKWIKGEPESARVSTQVNAVHFCRCISMLLYPLEHKGCLMWFNLFLGESSNPLLVDLCSPARGNNLLSLLKCNWNLHRDSLELIFSTIFICFCLSDNLIKQLRISSFMNNELKRRYPWIPWSSKDLGNVNLNNFKFTLFWATKGFMVRI